VEASTVNRTFAEDVLGGPADATLGTRFRYATRQDWFEVVGVVEDFPGFPRSPGSETEPAVYQPAAPGDVHPAVVSLRFAGPIPSGIAERLREVGAQIDPALQLRRVVPLSNFYEELCTAWRTIAWAAGVTTIPVLLLSAAGMHALTVLLDCQGEGTDRRRPNSLRTNSRTGSIMPARFARMTRSHSGSNFFQPAA
jgi:hypothetical protein